MIDQDTFARLHHVPVIEGISSQLLEGRAGCPGCSRSFFHDIMKVQFYMVLWSSSRLWEPKRSEYPGACGSCLYAGSFGTDSNQ